MRLKDNPNIKTTFFPRRSGDKVLKFIEQVKCDILAVDEKYPKKLKEELKKKRYYFARQLKSRNITNRWTKDGKK